MLFKTFIDESYVIAYGILFKKNLRNTTLCKRDSLYQNRSKYTDTYQAVAKKKNLRYVYKLIGLRRNWKKLGTALYLA